MSNLIYFRQHFAYEKKNMFELLITILFMRFRFSFKQIILLVYNS